jgi:hypothetical protein
MVFTEVMRDACLNPAELQRLFDLTAQRFDSDAQSEVDVEI